MEEPCKEYLYGRYQRGEDWWNRLHKKAAHKALDIPMDEDLHVNNSRNGWGWRELLVLGGLALAGWMLYQQQTSTPQPGTPPPQAPADSEYEVRFYDAAGNLIDIPNVAEKD
jgi:hypothetical protein